MFLNFEKINFYSITCFFIFKNSTVCHSNSEVASHLGGILLFTNIKSILFDSLHVAKLKTYSAKWSIEIQVL